MKAPSHLYQQAEGMTDCEGVDAVNLTAEQRFWAKVEKTDECWLWTAGTWRSRGGDVYGQFWDGSAKIVASRFSYQLVNGPVPQGMQVDHRCHNTLCVRPAHLRLASNKSNHENPSKVRSDNTSGITGVNWRADKGKWCAQVTHHGRGFHVGYFDTIDDAAEAVRIKRIELFTHNDADR